MRSKRKETRPPGRIRRRLGRLPRPTGFGWGFLVATVVLGAASGGYDRALLLLFGLFLATVLLSMVLPVWNLRRLSVERILPPNSYAGERFWVAARIVANGRATDAYDIVLEDGPEGPYSRPGYAMALRVRREEPAVVRYRVRLKDRGRHSVEGYRLVTRFPFGLFEYRVEGSFPSEMIVFPRIGHFREDPLPGSRFSRMMTATETVREKGQEEFRNIREYRQGDSPRMIAWKATAHHGELMVKEMEDDLTKRVTVFIETSLSPDARSRDRIRLERAISFAATLLVILAKRRYWLSVHYFDPEPRQDSAGRGSRHLDRVLERIAVLEPSETGGIHDLVARASPDALLRSLPVIVVPTLSEYKLREVLARLPGRRPPVVFRADGIWERSVFTTHEQVHG